MGENVGPRGYYAQADGPSGATVKSKEDKLTELRAEFLLLVQGKKIPAFDARMDNTPIKYFNDAAASSISPGMKKGAARVKYIQDEIPTLETLVSDRAVIEKVRAACDKYTRGNATEFDYAVLQFAHALLNVNAGVAAGNDSYTLAMGGIKLAPIPITAAAMEPVARGATPTRKISLQEFAESIPAEIESELVSGKFTSGRTIEDALKELTTVKDPEKMREMLPHILKALKILEKLGFVLDAAIEANLRELKFFSEGMVGVDAPLTTYETALKGLNKTWEDAKAFFNGVEAVIQTQNPNDLIHMLEETPQNRAVILINRINRLLSAHKGVRMNYMLESNLLPADNKMEALLKLKRFKAEWDVAAAEGQTRWAEIYNRHKARIDSNPSLGGLDKRAYDRIQTLPYFSAVAFSKAFDSMRKEGGISEVSEQLLLDTVMKLNALDPNLPQFFFLYALPSLAERCNGNWDMFQGRMVKIASKMNRLIDVARLDSLPAMQRAVFSRHLAEAFIRFQSIPKNIIDMFGQKELLGTYARQNPADPHNYELRQLGMLADDKTLFSITPGTVLMPSNLANMQPNQQIVRVSFGGIGEFDITPGNISLIPTESYAGAQANKTKVALSSGVSGRGISPYAVGSIIGGHTEGSLDWAIEKCFQGQNEPQYSIDPVALGGIFFYHGEETKVSEMIGGIAGYLTPTGAIGGALGMKEIYGGGKTQLYTLTATGIPIGYLTDTGLMFNVHQAGGGIKIEETNAGTDSAGNLVTAKQREILGQFYASHATERDERTGELKDPGVILLYVWTQESDVPNETDLDKVDSSSRWRVEMFVLKGNHLFKAYAGMDSELAPQNFAGADYVNDEVTVGFNVFGFGRDEHLLRRIPGYSDEIAPYDTDLATLAADRKKTVTALENKIKDASIRRDDLQQQLGDMPATTPDAIRQAKIDEWNAARAEVDSLTVQLKQANDTYDALDAAKKTQRQQVVDRYMQKLKIGGGAVLAVNLGAGWATASMATSTPGLIGDTPWVEWVQAVSKTWKKTAAFDKGTATLVVGFPGIKGLEEDVRAKFTQSAHISWREVSAEKGADPKGTGIPEAWQIDVLGGGGRTVTDEQVWLVGARARYQGPSGVRRIGGNVSYAREDAYYDQMYNQLVSTNNATLRDLMEQMGYMNQFYARFYYGDQVAPNLLLGTIGDALFEWKKIADGATDDKTRTEAYWKIAFILAAVNETWGLKLTAVRTSGNKMVFGQLSDLMTMVAMNPSTSDAAMKQHLDRAKGEIDNFFQEYAIEGAIGKQGYIEFRVLAKEGDDQYHLDRIENLSGRAVYDFGNGFIRAAGVYPVTTLVTPATTTPGTISDGTSKRIGWVSVGGGATFANSRAFHRFAADLLFLPSSDGLQGMGATTTTALYEDTTKGFYLLANILSDMDQNNYRVDAGFVADVARTGQFYVIYDRSKGNVFFTTKDDEVRDAIIAGFSITRYFKDDKKTALKFDFIGEVPLQHANRPAIASGLTVSWAEGTGRMGITLGGSLTSKYALPLISSELMQAPAWSSNYGGREWTAALGLFLTYSWGKGALPTGSTFAPTLSVPRTYTPLETGTQGTINPLEKR